jgi:hypothetical protein
MGKVGSVDWGSREDAKTQRGGGKSKVEGKRRGRVGNREGAEGAKVGGEFGGVGWGWGWLWVFGCFVFGGEGTGLDDDAVRGVDEAADGGVDLVEGDGGDFGGV